VASTGQSSSSRFQKCRRAAVSNGPVDLGVDTADQNRQLCEHGESGFPRLACADQISYSFVFRVWHPDGAPIRFHPVTGFDRTSVGATTSQATPSIASCQYSTYPVGPAS
jgi:hypothetical protein